MAKAAGKAVVVGLKWLWDNLGTVGAALSACAVIFAFCLPFAVVVNTVATIKDAGSCVSGSGDGCLYGLLDAVSWGTVVFNPDSYFGHLVPFVLNAMIFVANYTQLGTK